MVKMKKHFRMTFDFDVIISDITMERVHERANKFSNPDDALRNPLVWENGEREKRLLHALLEDDGILREYIKTQLIYMLDPEAQGDIKDVVEVEYRDEKVLQPIFEKMDDKDAAYFADAIKAECFLDSIEHLSKSFETKIVRAALEEIS